MTEPTVVTAQDLQDARLAQLRELRTYIASILPMIDTIRHSEVGGYALWMGGLPQSVSQAESQLTFITGTLTQTFNLDGDTPPQAPAQ